MTGTKIYEVVVEEVHSGDDLVLMVDLGVDGLFKKVRARLRGVDTPSAFRAGKASEAGELRDAVRAIVAQGKATVELHSHGRGGWMVTLLVSTRDGEINVNETLIAKGYVYHNKQETQ
jgi:hypothetical protein